MFEHHHDLHAWDYLVGGAGCEQTIRANRKAFGDWGIQPRAFVNVADATLATNITLKDRKFELPAPLILAPIGFHDLFDVTNEPKLAEIAVARAVATLGIPMVVSCLCHKPIGKIGTVLAKDSFWFQIYWHADDERAKRLVDLAQAAGCTALVLTGDTPCQGWKIRDLTNRFPPFKDTPVNYGNEPLRDFVANCPQPRVDWHIVEQLRSSTTIPVLVKGIMDPQDAVRARNCGVAGIIVSNHGGRQVDGSVGALTMLPQITAAVGDAIPVLFDSGIRTGADIFKAIALGARAVLIGRPYIYGLIVGGEQGVEHVIKDLCAELVLTMAAAGHADLSTINGQTVKP